MLDMGRKFYDKNRWNTVLLKATILHLIIFDCVNVIDAILIVAQPRETSSLPLFICQVMYFLF
jgi:hypothetical protein